MYAIYIGKQVPMQNNSVFTTQVANSVSTKLYMKAALTDTTILFSMVEGGLISLAFPERELL